MSEFENYEDIYPGCRPPYGPELTQTAAEKARKTVPFVVRAAMPADTAALDTLFRASYGALLAQDYAPGVLARALPALFHTSPRLLSAESFFVAEAGDGEIIAAGGWSQATPFGGVGPREIGHIRRFAVHPALTRRGIGSVLFGHVRDHAERTGVARLCALSTLSARRFFEAHGLTATGDVDLTLRPGVNFPAVQMSAEL